MSGAEDRWSRIDAVVLPLLSVVAFLMALDMGVKGNMPEAFVISLLSIRLLLLSMESWWPASIPHSVAIARRMAGIGLVVGTPWLIWSWALS